MAMHLSEIIETNTQYLKTLAFYLTKNRSDADDLFQETITKIWTNANRFELTSNFRAWSQTIMRNTYLNSHRGMRKATFSVDATDMQNGLYDNRLAQNDGETNIRYENLMNVVNTLGERKRTVFLTYTKGYSYEEMAKMYDLNIQNLRGIVFSARQELQLKLEKMQAIAA
jgi:RNA polymerase sigma-70 factor, ECF subfamily